MTNSVRSLLIFLCVFFSLKSYSDNGYDLWLKYQKIENKALLNTYKNTLNSISFTGNTATLNAAKEEIVRGLSGLLNHEYTISKAVASTNALIIATKEHIDSQFTEQLKNDFTQLKKNGFIIKSITKKNRKYTIITSNDELGVLYGVFNFLRLIQTHKSINDLHIVDAPTIDIRLLNHWDNLDRTVERGYAGESIWNWHKLPDFIDQRYIDYARANASIGINGTVLTNVNSNALILTPQYLEKVTALANVFRPYGIKVYLTARFSAPIEIGGLSTADPLHKEVQQWWNDKAKEIYSQIPDFGGFLVKANSEGQPGPQNYGRNHVDGAKMLATAVAPYGGIVMWRAFVYSERDTDDRAKQAYTEFVPFDGQFPDNVIIQVKNGAIDFQPREPFHPMFGAMPKTNVMMEFQITQEYLGFSTHLVFLPKLYQEVLSSDTYVKGKGTTVANVIDGSLHTKKITAMAGVANIGSDLNWTGHPFAQANWYGFGRLAWNPHLSAEEIADEWLRSTFSNKDEFVEPMTDLLINSRETVVNYMTPLGLHHIMDTNHHYGPGPWVSNLSRPEWNPVYYHKADSLGIGFNRSTDGSNAVSQYSKELKTIYNNLESCPEELLLWFHHVPWNYKLKNGDTLWNNMALTYQKGVNEVAQMEATWKMMEPYVDNQRFQEVNMLLKIQLKEANWWKNACMLYFQQYANLPFPNGMEKPTKSLKYYQSLKFPFAPGIRPQWD